MFSFSLWDVYVYRHGLHKYCVDVRAAVWKYIAIDNTDELCFGVLNLGAYTILTLMHLFTDLFREEILT